MDAQLARSLGFDGLELSRAKVRNYLDAGYSEAELSALLRDLQIPALGFVTDLEREAGLADLLAEAEDHCRLAKAAGAEAVQVITGPINVEAVRAHPAFRPTYYFGSLLTEKYPHLAEGKLMKAG